MSGHSKFANIKHKKERNDAAKGKIFTIIEREIADKLALDEYKKYRVIQDKNYISDFDELITETKKLNNIWATTYKLSLILVFKIARNKSIS